MELKDLIGKTVICEKVGVINHEDGHLNDVHIKYVTGGILLQIEPCIFIDMGYMLGNFHSSAVNHIEGNLVHTRNSIYKITQANLDKNEDS